MDRAMKTVIVGCGSMAKHWVELACRIDAVDLVGLVDLNRDTALAMAKRNGLEPSLVYPTLGDAIAATGADAVFDVTVPGAHAAVTIEALGLGCHVLGEKPMSDDLDDARRMVVTAKRVGKTYAVTQSRRPLAGFMSVAGFLGEGGLGEVEAVHSDFFIGAHFGGFRDTMDQPLLLDMAIHTFDNARQLSGTDPRSVYCQTWNPRHSWYAGDASAIAVFEMTNGVVYTYRGSWCDEGQHTAWESDWRIVGSRGSLTWDGNEKGTAQVVQPDGDHGFHSVFNTIDLPIRPLACEGHEYLIREFAAHVISGGELPVTCNCEDNIKSLAMVLAAVRSAETGQRVDVVW